MPHLLFSHWLYSGARMGKGWGEEARLVPLQTTTCLLLPRTPSAPLLKDCQEKMTARTVGWKRCGSSSQRSWVRVQSPSARAVGYMEIFPSITHFPRKSFHGSIAHLRIIPFFVPLSMQLPFSLTPRSLESFQPLCPCKSCWDQWKQEKTAWKIISSHPILFYF